MRALDQVLGVERLTQLAVQQRRLRGALGVGLGREEPEQPRLADDLAGAGHAADADVVHALELVDRRRGVGLGDQQQVAARGALADAGRQVRERHAGREGRALLVAQDPEPRVGDHADAGLGDLVLARPEQHEVALQQPLEEVGDLVDLVARIAGGARAGDGDHVVDALGQRLEVGHDLAHGDERLADGAVDLLQLLVVQPAREVEVHDRLALLGVARAADADDAAVAVALDADHRVQQPRDLEPVRLQGAGDAVDQERPVVGVGLHDRAERLVAVLGDGRVEGADGDRLVAARGRELERVDDLGGHLLGRDPLRRVAGEASQVGLGERADGVRAFGGDLLPDQLQQPARRRRAGLGLLREAHGIPHHALPGRSMPAWPARLRAGRASRAAGGRRTARGTRPPARARRAGPPRRR